VIDEVKAAGSRIILFMTEQTRLIVAGGQAGKVVMRPTAQAGPSRAEAGTIDAHTGRIKPSTSEGPDPWRGAFSSFRLPEASISEAVTILRGLAPGLREKAMASTCAMDAGGRRCELSARLFGPAAANCPDKAVWDCAGTLLRRVRIRPWPRPSDALERFAHRGWRKITARSY